MEPLEIDLGRISRLAAARQDEYEVLRHQLQLDDEIDDARLDAFVEDIARPIRQAIDCTQCANCCRSIDIYIVPDDIQRLAAGMGRSQESVAAEFVANPDSGEDMMLCSRPCKLLRGNLCSVYAHRPESCRDYPAFSPDFRWLLENTIAGAGMCPIIYHTLSVVMERIDSAYGTISRGNE